MLFTTRRIDTGSTSGSIEGVFEDFAIVFVVLVSGDWINSDPNRRSLRAGLAHRKQEASSIGRHDVGIGRGPSERVDVDHFRHFERSQGRQQRLQLFGSPLSRRAWHMSKGAPCTEGA